MINIRWYAVAVKAVSAKAKTVFLSCKEEAYQEKTSPKLSLT
jgi:hypothetical protein